MRIEHLLSTLIAVLCLVAIIFPVNSLQEFNQSFFSFRTKRSPRGRHHTPETDDLYDPYYKHEVALEEPGMLRNLRQNQMLIKHEAKNRSTVDCCPSVLEMVEPEGGKNQDDQYVELYRDGDNRQRFYELSCHKDIVGKPCRFIDRKLHDSSKCVQKYSYAYALVKDPGRHHHQRPNHFPSFPASGQTWTLDYIRVRSGCSCVVVPNAKKKRDRKLKNKRTRHDDRQ